MATDPIYGVTRFPSTGPCLFSGHFLASRLARVLQGGMNRRDNIVAFAGGGKASATALTNTLNRIVTVASANDSVVLPPAIAGSEVTVINAGANTAAVFSKGTDTIGTNNAATADTISTTKAKKYTCITRGKWDITSAT